jgi:6,7-dimethyl-8-ribityllumazine synthase
VSAPHTTIEGHLVASDMTFAIIHSRWNHFICDRLLEGSLDAIGRHGGDLSKVTVYKVPGCFELPLAAQKAAATGKFDAVIALGVLIRGSTPHFDYIAAEATKGLASASMSTGVPVSFGVITTNTIEQAIERGGTKAGNKGSEAALAAIEMVNLLSQM